MNRRHFPSSLLAALLLVALPATPGSAKTSTKKKAQAPADPNAKGKAGDTAQRDDATRLQLFLDREGFGPGKIDGRYGGFTKLAWLHWQQAHGQAQPEDKFDAKAAPISVIDPVFTTYTITAEDLGAIGPVPSTPPEQAKLKALTYTSLTEMLGERFHSDVEFVKELNPGKDVNALKEGETVMVPNVASPFDLSRVSAFRDHEREKTKERKKAKEKAATPDGAKTADNPSKPGASPAPETPTNPPAPPAAAVVPLSPAAFIHVSVKECYVELRDGDHTVAAFPITPGSKSIPTPVGEWKIEEKALFPIFRWDKEMLEHGRRSENAYVLPPGPNNPVGVVWIQLNKPGIGLHGTNEPDTIGRAASHGCIRLANWDAYRLYGLVKPGMKVVIE